MELIARGRAADVYDAGPGLVLRRYRLDVDATAEAEVMAYVGDQGYPVPRVESATGRDLVMERIEGPTMLAVLSSKPWQLRQHARGLAALHTRLGSLPALPTFRRLGDGDRMIHLDLHPDNVILGPRGPVVIDWTNARAGSAALDVADTWLLLACARPDDAGVVVRAGQALLARTFVAAAGRAAAVGELHAAYAHRVGDHNMSTDEIARMRALVRNETGVEPNEPTGPTGPLAPPDPTDGQSAAST